MAASLGGNRQPLRCIVKLGGAAVTVKDKFETLNDEILSVTVQQLRDATGLGADEELSMDWSRRHGSDEPVPAHNFPPNVSQDTNGFLVVHGAGSFGHFQASRAKLNKGGLGTQLFTAGFVATRISVTRLNLEIVRAFASAGIPAVGIPPFAAGMSRQNAPVEYVEKALDAGFMPVLHGDGVLDDAAQSSAILSGDVIVSKLALTLKPSYVVFLTNVPGIFDRPPSDPRAILLKEIAVEDGGAWVTIDPHATKVETNIAAHDTTGGMATKIAEAASIAAKGIDVLIAKAGSSHALQALKGTPLLSRDHWVGTLIRKARPGEIAE